VALSLSFCVLPRDFVLVRIGAVTAVASGVVDTDDRLLAAEPRLAALQHAAGGSVGDVLAVPALVGIARLARALGILVSRSVIVADGDHDLELLVRAKPVGDTVEFVIGDWTPRPQRRPWLMSQPADDADATEAEPAPQFSWAVDAALLLTEAPDSAVIGKSLTQMFRLIENPVLDLPLLAALAARSDIVDQRAVLRGAPATELRLDAAVQRDAAGAFTGFAGTARAVTSDMVAGAAIDDGAFAARLEAALRAPLARIAASADHIGAQIDGPLRRDYADYAGDIGSAARHLLALVDDLSDLQAIERPDFRIEPDTIDLADLGRRAAGLLQVRASDRGVRIDRPAPGDTLSARGDFRRVLQIVVNLIGNAVRYSPSGAMVWLRTEHDADTAVLIVADQGKGIAPENHDRIFEKFERVDPSETEGSGLGLYISRSLARAMGGDITVDSAPGQGARFVLTLPAA
jgi:signal transduction histidine kinase